MTRGQLAAGLTLAAGAAVLAGALVWISRTTLRLEAAESEARRLAAQEEKARLALWRLDSALTAIVGRENARPAERFAAAPAGPAEPDPIEHRRFEVEPAGTSPVPATLLSQALEQAPAVPTSPPVTAPPPAPEPKEAAALQSQLNTAEFEQRARNANQQSSFVPQPEQPPAKIQPAPQPEQKTEPTPVQKPVPPAELKTDSTPAFQPKPERKLKPIRKREPSRVETTFQPAWIAGQLYLVRRIRQDGQARLQTLWLDWPALRGNLLGQIRDLLPGADLLPVTAGETADPGRRLALLPVRLVPGFLPAPVPQPGWTPARLTLAAGSGAIALSGLAVTALLLGSLRQSRRRADFVSAVTHELRTPLTTVRMYSEMLAEGMVPPAGQADYLATLRAEAERLGHLVENVLAYSRLERSSQGARSQQIEAMAINPLLEGMAHRLSERAARDGFTLVVHPSGGGAPHPQVKADPGALERILFNWVDNACKYAAEAEDRRLDISASRRGRFVVLRLADHGPGVPADARRRIFRPFHKSAARAAASAPGVGLGLALSRRLARSLGGDLRLAEGPPGTGAAFELLLPISSFA